MKNKIDETTIILAISPEAWEECSGYKASSDIKTLNYEKMVKAIAKAIKDKDSNKLGKILMPHAVKFVNKTRLDNLESAYIKGVKQ